MSYLVNFYNITEDPRVINKNIPQNPTTSSSVNLTHPCNILYPTLLLSYNTTVINQTNYFYIDEFNKFYFINSVTVVEGGKMQVQGSIDYLKSYADSILNINATIVRKEKDGPTLVADSKFPLYTGQYNIDMQDFKTTPFRRAYTGNNSYILTVIGKGPGSQQVGGGN